VSVNAGHFHERYELQGRLGVGGMSTVRLAFDTRLERHVAVKVLAEHLAEDPAFVARFQREAVAAGRLVHPNIVQTFDSGLDPGTGQYFIVMEYVDGASCAQLLRDQGRLDVDEGLAVIAQACAGLDYAHRHGVVHRDVKPGNLLRSEEGTVKLADFGIARATDQSSITQVGSVLGTAAYLAPEQARGEEAGPPADLYSLGVVAYQLLAGRLPYEAGSLTELALRQQEGPPPELDALNPEVTPALARAIARALAAEPAARYDSALGMRGALTAAGRGVEPPASEYDPYPSDELTRALPDDEGATRAMTGATGERAVSHRRIEARPPRSRESARPRPVAAPGSRRNQRRDARRAVRADRRRRRMRKLAFLVVLLAALAGGAVAAYDALAPQASDIGHFVYTDVNQGVSDLTQFIHDRTK